MVPSVHDIGRETRVLVVDDFLDEAQELRDKAIAMAPFAPEAETYYPGLRRIISDEDEMVGRYVTQTLARLAPLMKTTFGVERLKPTESAFCLVTRRPEELDRVQHIPHFDRTDPGYFAFLLFLSPSPLGGTSYYRHRSTGLERIDDRRQAFYDLLRDAELSAFGEPPVGFIGDSTDLFERTGYFEGIYNRLLVYQGSILHSGFIPPNFAYSDDPRTGRLTFNIFAQS